MAKFNDEWIVQPHGPVELIDEGLMSIAGDISMPLGNFPRRMTVVALPDGRSAIWSAIPLREQEMREIEALGKPAFLIVPGIGHRLDIQAWKKRFPDARVICPSGARDMVEQVIPVEGSEDAIDDPDVRMEAVPGVEAREGALLVRRKGGTTLIVNDILANVRHPNGIGAHIMARLMGFGVKRPQMPWVGKRMFVKDQKALAGGFRRWADQDDLIHIIVSHGDIITDDPRGVLRRVADELDG